jgi:hypothetical protein
VPTPEQRGILYPQSFLLAAQLEREVVGRVFPDAATEADGRLLDPEAVAPEVLVATGAMHILQQTEPQNQDGYDPKRAAEALFRRKGLQRRVTAALTDLVFPDSYRRLGELRDEASGGSLEIASMCPGEEYLLEFANRRGRIGRLVVMRDRAGDDPGSLSVITSSPTGRAVRQDIIGSKLPIGAAVWLGYLRGSNNFEPTLVKGASPTWSDQPKHSKDGWYYSNKRTAQRFMLRQVYWGTDTTLPLF